MEAADRVAAGDYAARVPERGPRRGAPAGAVVQRDDRAPADERGAAAQPPGRRRARAPDAARGDPGQPGRDDGRACTRPTAAHLAPVLDETKVMSRLLDDLQTLSTAEAGALRLHRELVEPGDARRRGRRRRSGPRPPTPACRSRAASRDGTAADRRRSPADRRGASPTCSRTRCATRRAAGRSWSRPPDDRRCVAFTVADTGSRDPGGRAGPRVRPVREGPGLPRSGPGARDREEPGPRPTAARSR